MIEWLINSPFSCGAVTFFLMWSDWMLTIAQEKERQNHYFEHYESYPINTIEGNPSLQNEVIKKKLINPKHLVSALILSAIIGFLVAYIPTNIKELSIGYFWGLFLIVILQHLSNLTGYIASRKGIQGKLRIHQRTLYLIQSGRYFSITIFLLIISVLSSSQLIYGLTIAGLTSTLRQIIWSRKVPKIDYN